MIRKLVKWLAISLFLLGLLMICLLKLVERAPDQLKVGFESYLTQISGYPAEITQLKSIRFFPAFHVDARNIRLWPLDDPGGRVLAIAEANIDIPLWSLMVNRLRFSQFNLKDIYIGPELTGNQPVVIDHLTVNDEQEALEAAASLGKLRFDASAPLQAVGEGKRVYRAIAPPLRVSGTIEGGKTEGSYFIDLNKGRYGATVTFSRYRADDLRPLQLLFEKRLEGGADRLFPVQLHIETLEGSAGPYIFEQMTLENGRLQPLECLFNNQARMAPPAHPCAVYYETLENETPAR